MTDYRARHDIFEQAASLELTLSLLLASADGLRAFYESAAPAAIVFVGCGSSYSTSLSVAAAMQRRLGIPVYTVYGGDLMRHPEQYGSILRGALLVTLSRSGSTTETLQAVKWAKAQFGLPMLSVDCAPGSPLNQLADYKISVPWSQEEAVCQTKAVSNLYLAGMLIAAFWARDAALQADLADVVGEMRPLLAANPWEPWAGRPWERVFVLGDGELFGAAQEAALVLLEMSEMPAVCYSLLDVRHGPVVLLDPNSLVVLFASCAGEEWERSLVADLRRRGAEVLVVSARQRDGSGIVLDKPWSDAAFGLAAGVVAQALAFNQALLRGTNPDQPRDLTPWIDLSHEGK